MTTTKNINDGQKVFAYLRKSTKKAQQEQSIEKQKSSINNFANSLNIDIKNIEYFIDE
jgi:DNA invertase Pin-like site-specific DNA recombinase